MTEVEKLSNTELSKLTDDQAKFVSNMMLRRRNPAIYDKMMSTLKGQEQEIIAGLTRFPPVYVSPDVVLHPGLKVRFRSLLDVQTVDVQDATRRWMNESTASDVMAAHHMSKLFLAYGIDSINDEPLGNVQFSDEMAKSMMLQTKDSVEALKMFREARMQALLLKPASLVNLLVDANQIFNTFYDDVVSMRGTPGEVEERVSKMTQLVGNSTGPQVAGQKQA